MRFALCLWLSDCAPMSHDAFWFVKKAKPLFWKSKSTRYLQMRTDVLIGAGVRVEGNITFTVAGVLRIQGDVLGDVSCDVDSNGTIVVGESGNVTGMIKAPHIVVGGRVYGPVHSSQSIEIQQSAHVVGDAFYKTIDIHAGGVIEGLLTPGVSMDRDQVRQESRLQKWEPPAAKEYDTPLANAVPAGHAFGERFGRARKLGGAVTLLVAVVAIVYANRGSTLIAPPVADLALKADSSMKEISAARSAPVGSGGPRDAQRAISPVPGPDADTKSAAQASHSSIPLKDQDNVAAVQGVNPGKPADFFLAISKGPSVLYRKKRQDPADGKRIDISQGATESIAIAKNEIFRVASGRDIQIFYQGRKVAPKTIESGAWMSFVPQPPIGARENK